jgi:hypothetical protein
LTGALQAADCFPSPLIKLDVSISNIQLSDWFPRSTHASGPHHMVRARATWVRHNPSRCEMNCCETFCHALRKPPANSQAVR